MYNLIIENHNRKKLILHRLDPRILLKVTIVHKSTEPELPKVDHENQKNVNQHYKRLMSTKVTKCDVVDVMSE